VTYSSSNRSFSSQSIQCHNRILPAGTRVVGAKSPAENDRAVVLEGCDTRADLLPAEACSWLQL
jgi:hypothetical protein